MTLALISIVDPRTQGSRIGNWESERSANEGQEEREEQPNRRDGSGEIFWFGAERKTQHNTTAKRWEREKT